MRYVIKMLITYFLLFLTIKCVFGDKSFTMVVDTTASMKDEIDIFKYNLDSIMKAMTSGQFEDYILIPFLRLNPGPPLISQSPQGLVYLIDAIEVSDPYGCFENSLSAIMKGLEVSKSRSLIFVFTDAEAQDTDKLYSIQNLCENRQSQVIIFQSGSCYPNNQNPTENIYKKIVNSCGGSYVFFFYLKDLKQAFNYMREIIKEDWTEVTSHKEFFGSKEYSFVIDAYTKDVLVAISGYKPQIEITDNYGKKAMFDEIIVTDYLKVLRISGNIIGEYTADISCEGSTMMTVYRKKEFNFRYGFSPLQAKSLRETTLLPIPGIMNFLYISLPDNNLQLISIYLKISGEYENKNVNHHVIDENRKLYAATILIESQKTFQVLVKCRDSNNQEISGSSKQIKPQQLVTDFQRIAPQAEILESDPIIDFGTGYSLACKVYSYPKPDIWWENSKQERMNSESALLEIPHVYISYVKVENVTKNETIVCKCMNTEGENAIDVHLYVNRTFSFEVIQSPSDITIEYGSEGELVCEANAYPDAEIKWYHNDTLIEEDDNIEIIPENQKLVIKNMNLDTTGTYQCEISNTIETRTLSAEVYISGLESPEVNLNNSDILLKLGEQMNLQCPIIKGNPVPNISWKYKTKFDDNNLNDLPGGITTDGSELKIDSVELYHGGFYVCEAVNIIGMDEKLVSVKVQYAPKIRNEDEVKTVTFGEVVELACDVDAVPEADVHWIMYQNDVVVPFDSHHSTDYSNTHRFTANDKDSGIYECRAENSAGSAIRTVTLNVLVAPYIEPLAWRALTAGRGSIIVLNCNVSAGYPVPSSRWVFIDQNLETTVLLRGNSVGKLELVLKNITRKHEGSYQCIAENDVASDSVRVSLKVI